MTPQLRFSEFTDQWQVKRFGDIGKIAMCRRIFNSETSSNGDVPFYKIGTFGKTPNAFITRSQYEEYKDRYSFPNPGDALLSASGTIGRMVVYDGEPAYFQDSNIIWLKHDGTMVTNKFLEQIYARIKWVTESGTIQRLYNDIFLKTNIVVPSIPEQQKIASFMGGVESKLTSIQTKVAAMHEYKKGIMQALFSGKLRFKDENGNPYPDWEEKTLGELFSCAKGTGLSKDEVVPNGKNKCVLYGELYTRYPEVIDRVVGRTNSSSGTKSKAGDLLIPASTTTSGIDLANVTEIQEDGILLGGDISILRFKDTGSSRFFAYYLTHFKTREIARYAQGSTIVHLYFSHFKNLRVAVPSVDEQQRIADFLTAVDNKIKLEEAKLASAKEFKKALLQRMFV